MLENVVILESKCIYTNGDQNTSSNEPDPDNVMNPLLSPKAKILLSGGR